jgi:hypothetical protein
MGLATTKIDESFSEVTGQTLQTTSQLRLFNLLLDEDRQTQFLNIFKILKINTEVLADISFFDTYEVEGEGQMWWDHISYDVYGTPYLWWIVALFNDVTNPFEEIEPGQNLTILKPDHLYTLFKDIETVAEL